MSTPTAVANSSQNVAVTVYAQNTDASVRSSSFVNADCCAVTFACIAVGSCWPRMESAAPVDQFGARGLASPGGNPNEDTWENRQRWGIGRETRQSNAITSAVTAQKTPRAIAMIQSGFWKKSTVVAASS